MLNDKLITLAEAASMLPRRRGRAFGLSTIWRWCRHGVGPDRVRLEYVRLGRRIYTSADALGRFADRLVAADANGTPDNGTTSSPNSDAIDAGDGADQARDRLRQTGFFGPGHRQAPVDGR